MTSKYASLTEHLRGSPEGQCVTMSFSELSKVLGFPLPKSASTYRAWWANHRGTHPHANTWLDAGFAVENVNLAEATVRFVRKDGKRALLSGIPIQASTAKSSPAANYKVKRQDGCHLDLEQIKASLSES